MRLDVTIDQCGGWDACGCLRGGYVRYRDGISGYCDVGRGHFWHLLGVCAVGVNGLRDMWIVTLVLGWVLNVLCGLLLKLMYT